MPLEEWGDMTLLIKRQRQRQIQRQRQRQRTLCCLVALTAQSTSSRECRGHHSNCLYYNIKAELFPHQNSFSSRQVFMRSYKRQYRSKSVRCKTWIGANFKWTHLVDQIQYWDDHLVSKYHTGQKTWLAIVFLLNQIWYLACNHLVRCSVRQGTCLAIRLKIIVTVIAIFIHQWEGATPFHRKTWI